MAKIKDITDHLESIAPLSLQESYDNAGLITGDSDWDVTNVLISLDCTEDVVDEAIKKKCNLIVSHHPIVFNGLKRLTGSNYVERVVIKAIKNDIALYAIHTNLDNVKEGVNKKICEVLGVSPEGILAPINNLYKITTFVPKDHLDQVLTSMHKEGAGNIGNYEDCSFRVEGTGAFRSNSEANPFVGSKGKDEKVVEIRLEMIVSSENVNRVIDAMNLAHPYEEVAYYLNQLENPNQDRGAGMIAYLEEEMNPSDFLEYVKDKMQLQVIKHTRLLNDNIKKIAVCGGSGSFLIKDAIACGAQAFISSDIKYHEYFDAENKIILLDIGHYESEVYTKDLLGDILSQKFTTFAVNLSDTVTNPISYF